MYMYVLCVGGKRGRGECVCVCVCGYVDVGVIVWVGVGVIVWEMKCEGVTSLIAAVKYV